jgi:peptide/nickel transport system substrate-binding protein
MGSRRWIAAALACAFAIAPVTVPARAGGKGAALDAKTLVVGTRVDPRTLNPIAINASEGHQIAGLIFLTLLEEQDDFMSFKPQLARSWSVSENGLDVTFHLREDARWSDGVPLTAADVRFTWELQVDTTVAWPSASAKSRIREVEVLDTHTVVFHFTEKYLYQVMDANEGVILPRHLLARIPRREVKTCDFGRAPVGNGPYRVAKWEPAQFIELGRNPAYFGPPARVERVIVKFVPDAVTLVSQLKAGEIDLLESVQAGDLASIREKRPDVVIHEVDSRRMSFVAWNLKRAPFDDRKVRRALTMGIDRAGIINSVWGGYARECTSPIVPLLWAFDSTITAIPYDRAAARAALEARGIADAGHDGVRERNGEPFEIELLVNDAQNRVDVATMVQAQLKDVGVKVNLRVMEYGAFIDRVLALDYDAAFVEWKTATKVDLTGLFHTKSMRPHGYNFVSYSNPDVDRLIGEAVAQRDVAGAKALWSRIQRLVYEDQPYTFIAVPHELTAVDDRFCNVKPNAISFFANLARWGIAPDCAP